MKKIEKTTLNANELNALYAEGYRFYVEGDRHLTGMINPLDGMNCETYNLYIFEDKAAADAYAMTQTALFDENTRAEVYTIPAHTMTWAETLEARKAEKAARKAAKEAKEAEKAAKMGMTVEEYKAAKKRAAAIKEAKEEIERLEKALAAKRAYLKKLEG